MALDRTDPTFLTSYKGSEFVFGIAVEDGTGPLPIATENVVGRLQLRDPVSGVLLREWLTEDGTLQLDDSIGVTAVLPREAATFELATWGLELDGDVIVTGKLRLRDRVVADG